MCPRNCLSGEELGHEAMVKWGIERWRPLWSGELSPGLAPALTFAIICVAIATGVRLLLGLVSPDSAVFAPYYAATLIATLVGGAFAGSLATGLGALVACWLFIPPDWSVPPFLRENIISLVLYLVSCIVIVWAAKAHRELLRRVRAEENQRQLLNRELAHRIKNILMNAQGIVSQSLRGYPELLKTVNARITALATTHDLLVATGWRSASLGSILASEFAPYGPSRFETKGDDIECPSAVAVPLALIFHELTTNAVKYGALSRPDGHVAVCWRHHARRLEVDWIERGGPAPSPTPGKGFGTRLLQAGLKPFDGSVAVRFEPTGLVCRMSLTLPEEHDPAPLDFAESPAGPAKADLLREAASVHEVRLRPSMCHPAGREFSVVPRSFGVGSKEGQRH
jgi:two-component sensor histidine kinase